MNFVTIAKVRGRLEEAVLVRALAAAQARHPLLAARVVAGERATFGDVWFESVDARARPIPLRFVAAPADDWVRIAEEELSLRFDTATGPLARATLLRDEGDDEASLLVTLHHAIGDGMSGVYLVRDVVAAAAAIAEGRDPGLVEAAREAGLDDRLEARAGDAWRKAMFLSRALLASARGRPVKLRTDVDGTVLDRRPRVLAHELDEETTARLIARARAERTSVHGALSAAIVQGLLHDAGTTRPARVVFGSPVNVRKELVPPVADGVGFFVSLIGFDSVVDPRADFWELARAFKADLAVRTARGEASTALKVMPSVFSLLGGWRLPVREFAVAWEQKVPTSTGLTNLGRLEIEARHGGLTIERCHFVANTSALGDFGCMAASLGGRLSWNFVWPAPLLTEAHAVALVDDIVARAVGAARSP